MTTPTARALEWCRKQGYQAAVVERWIGPPRGQRIRVDVWGFGDLLVIDDDPGALLVQVTSSAGVSARKKKILTECADAAARWLDAGNRIEVWGWSKREIGKRERWTLDRTPIKRGDEHGEEQERIERQAQ